jgi:hypothetical protein
LGGLYQDEDAAMLDRWECNLLVGHGLTQQLRDADGVDYGRLDQTLLALPNPWLQQTHFARR